VEPSPIALPHLRRCHVDAARLDAIVISHFHADHTFGWPFLLLELLIVGRDRPLFVIGPPGVDEYLSEMMSLASVPDIQREAHARLDLRYIEVDGSWQAAGLLRFRAIEVEHVPHLRCFGYLLERDGRILGYSGDTRPCRGLDLLADASDVLVLECNGPHPPPVSHMDIDAVRSLRARFPTVPFVLTHQGAHNGAEGIADVIVPEDLQTVTV
jgi:ribonuclease BN (tRNA processing enzyme)